MGLSFLRGCRVKGHCLIYILTTPWLMRCDDGEKLKGVLRDAKRLLGEMTSCGLRPSVITYYLLMDWYCCVGMLEKVLYLHDELKSSSLSPTVITCKVLAAGCSRSEDSFRVLELVVETEERAISPSKITYTILIDFSQCNNMDKALELLAQMKMICLVADVYTYSRLLAVNFFNLRHQMERMQSEYFWDFDDLCSKAAVKCQRATVVWRNTVQSNISLFMAAKHYPHEPNFSPFSIFVCSAQFFWRNLDHVDNWRWPQDRSNMINLMTVESLVSDLNLNFENYIVVNKRGGCDMTLYFKEVGRVWRRRDSRALVGFQHFLDQKDQTELEVLEAAKQLVHLRVKPEHLCDELRGREDLEEVLRERLKGFLVELCCETLLDIDGLDEECGLSSLDNCHFSSM
ncbi:hypothetical protein SASPL_120206 [Salvia splendens]|uniref:Pentatricopeptide repeat-containing protein n=1 Tax=Salvia splendens TaxID=180675 RepID=A0A8X8XU50_SALSN|nr:hypothetical protein SASPL_120206 [Salvia splendens]